MIDDEISSRQMTSITLFYPNLPCSFPNSQFLPYSISYHRSTVSTIHTGFHFHPSNMNPNCQERGVSGSTTDGRGHTTYSFPSYSSSSDPISAIWKCTWSVWAFFIGGWVVVVCLRKGSVFLNWFGHVLILWLLIQQHTHRPSLLFLSFCSAGIHSFSLSPLFSHPFLRCAWSSKECFFFFFLLWLCCDCVREQLQV